jgi:hypothetical protein
MYKEDVVVMLPTEGKSYCALNSSKKMTNYVDGRNKPYQYKDKYDLSKINQHLYVISDEEIRKGDWICPDCH